MTKQQIVIDISKRLGDPSGTAFSDRIWGYFIEAFYESLPNLTETELLNLTKADTGLVTTNVEGRAYPVPSAQSKWNAIVSVNVAGIHPARRIDEKEFLMMRKNSFYMPSPGEYYYYFNGKDLVLLTGSISTEFTYTVNYIDDAYTLIGDAGSNDTLEIPNSIVFKLMPLTVNKMKQELGMML